MHRTIVSKSKIAIYKVQSYSTGKASPKRDRESESEAKYAHQS